VRNFRSLREPAEPLPSSSNQSKNANQCGVQEAVRAPAEDQIAHYRA
jgi:hypothetical protein